MEDGDYVPAPLKTADERNIHSGNWRAKGEKKDEGLLCVVT